MIATNLNVVLKSYLQANGYPDIEIYPINAYSSSVAPFITWLEFPSIKDGEQYWMYQSTLTYSVFDNDLSRGKDIALKIQSFLNVGDDIASLKAAMTGQSLEFRMLWSRMLGGGMFAPLEREGYTSINRIFEIGYVHV
jgi:hypothetical protein